MDQVWAMWADPWIQAAFGLVGTLLLLLVWLWYLDWRDARRIEAQRVIGRDQITQADRMRRHGVGQWRVDSK